MTFALLLALWATLIPMVWLELRRRSPALLFALGLLLAAGVPGTVYLFTGRFERPVVEQAILYIALFNLLYLISRLLLPGGRVIPDAAFDRRPVLPAAEKRLVGLVGLLFLLPFFLKLVEAGFSPQRLFSSTWRENLTISYVVILYGAHASFGLILCLFVWRRYALGALALLAAVALVVVDRRRVMGLAAVAPLLLVLGFWSLRGRAKVVRLAVAAGSGVLALLGFFLVQQIRYFGPLTAAAAAEPRLVVDAAVNHMLTLQGDLSLLEPFLWMITNGHYVDGYGDMITVQRMLLFWLPAEFKPPEFTHSIAAAIRGGGEGASLHPTIYGLSWGEALWFGVLYAPFLAGTFRLLDGLVTRYRGQVTWAVLLGPYSVFAVLAARGAMQTAWVVMLVTLSTLVALIHVAALTGRRITRHPAVPLPTGPPGDA
jgi:hypothetical protein